MPTTIRRKSDCLSSCPAGAFLRPAHQSSSANYGGIGSGHCPEISHALIPMVLPLIENGSLNGIQDGHDYQAFTERTQKVIDQFSKDKLCYGAKSQC